MQVSKERIEHLLKTSTAHFNRLHGTTTVCQIVLQNGFTLAIGTSSCVDPSIFNYELGMKYAKEDALKKAESELWKLEGYRLSMQLRPIK